MFEKEATDKPVNNLSCANLDCGNDEAKFGSRGRVTVFHESNQVKIHARSKDEILNIKPQRKVDSSLVYETPMSVVWKASSGSASSGQEVGSVAHLIGVIGRRWASTTFLETITTLLFQLKAHKALGFTYQEKLKQLRLEKP
nr:QWRF motif-containing protein 2-like [Ipomoea trifida]